MKNYLVIVFTIVSILTSHAQDSTGYFIERILNKKIEKTEVVSTKYTINKLYLKTPFAEADILNPEGIEKIKDKTVEKVELVYTTYKLAEEFSNPELNKKRLEALNAIAPELFSNPLIEWRIIAQTKCDNPEEGRHLFHGFIITFRPEPTKEVTEKEIAYLRSILNGKKPESIESPGGESESEEEQKVVIRESGFEYTVVDEFPDFVGGKKKFKKYLDKNLTFPEKYRKSDEKSTVIVSFTVGKDGKIKETAVLQGLDPEYDMQVLDVIMKMPDWKPAMLDGEAVDVILSIPIHFNFITKKWTAPFLYSGIPIMGNEKSMVVERKPVHINYFVPDSTVLKVFERHEEWNNMAIICDFTGSMYPYTAQLLVWYKLKISTDSNKIKLLTFFNDGNNKPDNKKKVGSTGGIYYGHSSTFEEVENLAYATMRGGGGGDCPENNVEAVINAIQRCKECDNIIMIADNYATPRDLSLLSKIKKPIHVILCGTRGGINIEYLNLVRENKGSLHTIEYDIDNLMELNEGEKIKFGDKTYIIIDGTFQEFYDL